jgi:hypothetical protein
MDTPQQTDMAKQRLSISLEDDLYQWLTEKAEDDVRSISNLVEFIVKREMEREKGLRKKTNG